jgi:hypothetical protein
MHGERGRVVRPFLPIWRKALGDESGVTFGEVVAPHVRLEGSIFATPIDGREKVWTSLRTAGSITDTLSFTHESTASDRSYLEWDLDDLFRGSWHGVASAERGGGCPRSALLPGR